VIHWEVSDAVERSTMQDVLSIYVPSFFIFLGMSIISPILPIYAESFKVSYTLVSLAVSMYAFGRFLADVPVGLLADRVGRRLMMVLGTIILTVCSFLNATAPTFILFLVYRLLEGVGSAMWMTSRTTLLADILKPEERGRIMSYFQAFMLLGSSAGPTVGGFIAMAYGLRAPFYAYAAVGILSFILTFFLIRDPEGVTRDHGKGIRFSLPTVKRLLMNSSFSMACLATFTIFFMRTGIRSTIIPLFANSILNLDADAIGIVISCATITNLIVTIPVGHAIDYFGRKPIIVMTLTVTALSTLIFPFTTNFITICAAAVVLGIGTGGAGQAPLALATDATLHEPHGLSMGLYRLFGDVGFVVGPILMGFIADNFDLLMPFYVTTVIIIVNVALVQVFAKETYSKRRDKEAKVEA
jgi:DHA1 family multidrug resistance protein-like MFS transporter